MPFLNLCQLNEHGFQFVYRVLDSGLRFPVEPDIFIAPEVVQPPKGISLRVKLMLKVASSALTIAIRQIPSDMKFCPCNEMSAL